MEIVQEEVTKELKDKLNTHFDRHYESTHGISGFGEEVCFCVLSEKKEKVAVLIGEGIWGGLHITYLWTQEAYRNKGLSTKLLEAAFEYGKAKGCTFAYVETMNKPALDFYKRRGFELEFERKGHTHGCIFCSLRKDFSV